MERGMTTGYTNLIKWNGEKRRDDKAAYSVFCWLTLNLKEKSLWEKLPIELPERHRAMTTRRNVE